MPIRDSDRSPRNPVYGMVAPIGAFQCIPVVSSVRAGLTYVPITHL